ncbi:nif-specific transcriptional activator NifA [Halioxenophilus sp. WMMB6]|uniref:nif-specific transcriptional activator NifA n=1 Tax=Halioxenophilus sp. WMMB6 TaxID=3073815 RepID=UPI00295E4885|nr:nif-specific transcriptional activator NifA [Halioxenophilus sp. WMMB6]
MKAFNLHDEKMTAMFDSRQKLLEKEMEVVYQISRVLCRHEEIEKTHAEILSLLDQEMGLAVGLVGLCDDQQSELRINAINVTDPQLRKQASSVRYKAGEGILGKVLSSGESIVLGRVESAPTFLHKLDIYDYTLPFIGVPIKEGNGKVIGVLAVQPDFPAQEFLSDLTRFLSSVANLLAHNIHAGGTQDAGSNTSVERRDDAVRQKRVKYSFDNMVVGSSEPMRKIFEQIKRVGKWDSTVLIRGESGTGKELIASSIHYNSPRSNKPFVKLNCAALPENLLESELFGHEKGAFTGAIKQRQGRFEQADGGTLFLDEIGEISPMFQAKLLRVLQENELERVGGNQTIKVNVRIVAATNRNLESDIEEGKFREDLYYRLNVMPINLPPLRERLEDIPELSEFLVGKIAKQQGRELRITEGGVRKLMSYHWPGNVRELENCLERAAVMCEDSCIDLDVISLNTTSETNVFETNNRAAVPAVDLKDDSLDERERVTAALEQAGWVQARAARLLGMTPRQIAYRIQTLKINVRKI